MTLTDDFRRLAALGFTGTEAAAQLGCAPQAAFSSARRNGFRFPTEAEATLSRLRDCAAEGLTLTAAARHMGRDRKHLSKVAKAAGLTFVGGNNRRRLAEMPADRRADYRLFTMTKRLPAAEALAIVEPRP